MIIDIDHFKRINDEFGHQAGDQALQHFVKSTKNMLRQKDLFGRLGGEEFAILLLNTDLNAARQIGARIQDNLKQHPLDIAGNQNITIKISIGLTKIPQAEAYRSLDFWISQADQALYQAKSDGRNQIRVADQT